MAIVAPIPDLEALAPGPEDEPTRARLVGYRRTPRDLFRSLVLLAVSLVLLVRALVAQDEIAGLERSILTLFDFLDNETERIAVGLLQLLVGGSQIAALLIPIVTRRFRVLGYVALAMAVGSLLAQGADLAIGDVSVGRVTDRPAGLGVEGYPSMAGLAALAGAFVALGPFVGRRWRRFGFGIVVVAALLRVAVSVELPSDLLLSLAIGAMGGALVLYAFGRPDERPTDDGVVRALRGAGLPVIALDAADVDARGSTPYFGTLADGSRFFAKVLGSEERSADLLFRTYRYLRFRNLGDERPFSSLRRAVEHEAFVSLQARDLGVRTPRLRAVADVGRDCLLLAYDLIEGRTLDKLDEAAVTDELMVAIWEQVRILRDHRIAHRDLRRANILVDPDGEPWLIDFGFAEVAASDALLESDIAQLACAFAVAVDPAHVVGTALEVLGPEALASCLPRLQMAALSGATQTALRHRKGLLEQVRTEIEARTGVEQVKLEPLQRVSAKQLFTLVMLVAVTYFLLPQFADLPAVWRHVKDANWWWFVPVVIASACTYFAATLSFMGSIPDRLRLVPTFVTQVASSFVSKVAPAGLGGMALNIRYAQKSGVDPAVAVSGVGLNSAMGFIVHMVMLVVFAVWAGRDAFGSIRLPDPAALLWGFLVVALLTALSLAVPVVRRLLRDKLLPILQRGFRAIVTIGKSPAKLLLLVGGSVLVTLSYIVALFFATKAFGGDLSFARVGSIYLLGSTVAAAAPTPGGLGALEAALVAGLTAAGMPGSVALPSVFLMRLGTFWLPILPGWACFTWLRRTEHI